MERHRYQMKQCAPRAYTWRSWKGVALDCIQRDPICLYWDHLLMVAPLGQYYGAPLRGSHRVTHGDLLSSTIFNVVVDDII